MEVLMTVIALPCRLNPADAECLKNHVTNNGTGELTVMETGTERPTPSEAVHYYVDLGLAGHVETRIYFTVAEVREIIAKSKN